MGPGEKSPLRIQSLLTPKCVPPKSDLPPSKPMTSHVNIQKRDIQGLNPQEVVCSIRD